MITCIGMTLSIALEPFTQNLVRFYNDNVVDTKTAAWVTKGNWYNITGPQYMYRGKVLFVFSFYFCFFLNWLLFIAIYSSSCLFFYKDYSPDPILKINIQNAISYLGQPNTVSNPAFSCPSGNCTFPTFTTLAYCASCTDISDRITRDCGSCNETSNYVCGYDPCNVQIRGSNLSIQYYPGGAGQSISYAADALKGKDALVYTNDTLPDHFPNVFQSLRAVQNQTLAREGTLSLRKDTKLVATECVLSPCIQGIKAIVERGVYKQTIIKLIQPAMIPYKAGYTAINLTLPEDRDLGLVNLTDRSFGIISQVLSSWSARDFPGKMLKGNVTTIDSLQGLMFSNDQTEAIFFANTSHRHCSTNESFACAIHATADAFTKTIRDAQFLVGGDTDLNLVMGSVMVNQTFVRVQWYWITLHIAIWLLTTIGWATAFYNTKKTGIPAWKGSPIPLLVLYREDTYGGEGPLIQTTSSGLYYNPKTMTTCLEDISNVNARLYGNNEGTIRLSIPISRQQTKS